ncbi:MAG TPA: PSD1 and planctomycete cytochrome C domain-containing protein [Bryobacteraceae bacterium]|nr:PSD1 and planctomycete cytochrome C domain-containing protein [Bryobacteraceae bacterium]
MLRVRPQNFLVGVAWLVSVAAASGEAPQFEESAGPLLEARCAKCHSGSAPQAGLNVTSRTTLLKGGNSGPAIVAGAPDGSLLVKRVSQGEMPPGGPKLSDAEIAILRSWIAAGAPARNEALVEHIPGTAPAERAHWAFQTPRRPAMPAVKAAARVRSPLDAFVLAELEKRNLGFSPDADKITLLRRAWFDLAGLPPPPEEVDRFLADTSPNAYEKLVDRLLASPRYGERWARHWLDLAGYADSEGVLAADVIRPNAWRYRDYVIRALNADKPYDRFLTEQIAGDEASRYFDQDRLTPSTIEALEATGFLRTAVDATREDFLPEAFAEYTWRTAFDTEQIVASSVLGLTLQCARCHDHKYEPLSQKDYYRFLAFFAGGIRPNGAVLPTYKRQIALATAREKKAAEENNGPVEPVIKALRQLQAARLAEYRARHPKKDRATEAELREMFPDYAAKADALAEELRQEEAKIIQLPEIRAFYDLDGTPPATHVFRRGDPKHPEEEVAPGVPVVLDALDRPFEVARPAEGAKTSGRRLALAEWLTRPDNPLTARVFVNRVWAEHFGTGIVPSLDNFGRSGAPPTNQPLLDWLATEFVRQGWSIKNLHRLIMTSTVYRQSSRANDAGLQADPDDRLLWRMPPRRLEAEIIRDAILETAGSLDFTMYGPPVAAHTKPSGEVAPEDDNCQGRRSIYQIVRRSAPQSFLNAFDAPIMETNCTRRTVSTTATQALALMNSEFVAAQAEHFARRVLRHARTAKLSEAGTIEYAFRLALARRPDAAEAETLTRFLRTQAGHYTKLPADEQRVRVYADLCQALVSSNEFIYVD